MITCGPWKDIRLEAFTSRISDVHAVVKLLEGSTSATVELSIEIQHRVEGLLVRGDCGSGQAGTPECSTTASSYNMLFKIERPRLWWPLGHGPQHLYEATVRLLDGETELHCVKVKYGVRKVELVRRHLKGVEGETFFFRINNRPIFCVGTNWIPCHSLPALNSHELYEENLKYAVEGNNNMIRIWGGGIYENDEFYEYCDEKGLMVWHDMMFACGIYPVDESFHKSVKEELEAQVKRLRNHPCITLWNGDNEFYFMADRQDVPYDASEEKDWQLYPERKLYFDTIPSVISKLSSIPYWPSSPFGGKDANDPTQGDIHQWNVWHNLGFHYQQYPQLGGRFVSEYGMHGLPDIRTVKHYCPDERYRCVQRSQYFKPAMH